MGRKNIRACPSADAFSKFRDSYAFIPLTVIATIAARYATVQAAIVVTIFVRSFASRPASRGAFFLYLSSVYTFLLFFQLFLPIIAFIAYASCTILCNARNCSCIASCISFCILPARFLQKAACFCSVSVRCCINFSLSLHSAALLRPQFLHFPAVSCQKPAARTHFCAGRPVSLFENL